MNKKLDVVVFGATGFTGQLIARYLHRQYSGLNWGMAGRNLEKLQEVRSALGIDESIPLLLADATDSGSMAELAAHTKVMIAAAGPYQLYGEPLLSACVHAGCDYVDLCGEPTWMRQMIEQYSDAAKASGANIVHSCGFDSVPSDLGVWQLQQLAQKTFGAPFNRVKARVEAMQGGPSGGTIASFMVSAQSASQDPKIGALMIDPFALTPGARGVKQPSGNKVLFDEALNSWVAPFVMAVINTKNVHRTNALLGNPYGQEFQYDEMVATGSGEQGEQAAKNMAKGNGLTGKGSIPKPGEGPSPEEQEAGHFTIAFHGVSEQGNLSVRISGDKDPGYGCTSMMIAESALCLLEQSQHLGGGFWTPAAAMAQPLIDRLSNAEVLHFSVDMK